jgi:hypothetical protein
MTTFRQYLAARKPRNDSPGAFVPLALRDHDMPAIQSLRQLKAYVSGRAALSPFFEPASQVWAEYAGAASKAEAVLAGSPQVTPAVDRARAAGLTDEGARELFRADHFSAENNESRYRDGHQG